jgi:hypothetical protein
MTDRYVILQNKRALIPHHMPNRAILNIRVFPDANDVHISPDDAVVPDTGVIADFDVADNLSARRDVYAFTQLRPFSLVLMQHARPPDKTSKLADFRDFTQCARS